MPMRMLNPVSGAGRIVELCHSPSRRRHGTWLPKRIVLWRPSFGVTRRPTSVQADKFGYRQSYDDLTQSYARSLQREEAQLAAKTPPLVQLMEITEGLCLLTAVALQLFPVVYAIMQQRRLERSRLTAQPKEELSKATAEGIEADEEKAVDEERVVEVVPHLPPLKLDHSQFSLWSVLALMIGVVLGSILRRFRHRQWERRMRIHPSPPSMLQAIEHQEMENGISRAFTEISHLAGQLEKLRVKVRVLSRDYGTAFENSSAQSSHFKQALQELVGQVKGTEAKIQDVQAIMDKMQGFQAKQFVVVSSALRRLDQECKSLQSQQPAVATSDNEAAVLSETEQNATSPVDVPQTSA